jgi:hypothetical protein
MAPQTPLFLLDNLFDTVQQYPNGTVTADSYRTGHEPFRVASYRRERSSLQYPASAANHWLAVDLGLGAARDVDYLFLDRGHNLWGRTVFVQWSNDGTSWNTLRTCYIPSIGTLGGDPTSSTGTVTEEGAWWGLLTGVGTGQRYWRLLFPDTFAPVVTGVMLGKRLQLLGFTAGFDEDAAGRTADTVNSPAGYRATSTTYSWRTLSLTLSLLGVAEYDAGIRALRASMFTHNQPAVVVMDYGTRPERGWMYQYDGTAWTMPKKRTYREGRLTLREVGPSLS